MNIYSVANVAVELTCLLITASLVICIVVSNLYRTKLVKILLLMLSVSGGIMAFDAIAWWFAGRTEPYVHSLLLVANCIVFLLSYWQHVLIAYYLTTYLSALGLKVSRTILYISMAFSIFMTVLIIITQRTGWIYSIDENNVFSYGPLSSFVVISSIFLHSLSFYLLIYFRSYLGKEDIGILLFFLTLPIFASVAEMFIPQIMLTHIATTVAFIVLILSVQVRQEINAVERELEVRTAIALSQIQPHFLYNVLSTIEALCEKDTKRAGVAIHTFSRYLRRNLDSLSYRQPIPFEKELEHVRNYLLLEEMRFEERLQVEFDIQATDFLIPSLTLQPLVENAVHHGVTKQEQGGKVTIYSRETQDNWQITITDNGVGFTPSTEPDDEYAHVGIDNVRHRLEGICDGKLTIFSVPGVETTVDILIPKERRKR